MKTQRIEVLVSVGGTDELGEFNYGPGEQELPAARAAQFVKAGHAQAIEPARKKSAPAASSKKAPAKRRRSKGS